MQHLARTLFGYRIQCPDAVCGRLADILFDDRLWMVRYFVLKTSRWFGETLFIPAEQVSRIDGRRRTIEVVVTKGNLLRTPASDSHVPVFDREQFLLRQFLGPVLSGLFLFVPLVPTETDEASESPAPGQVHLHSIAAMSAFRADRRGRAPERLAGLCIDDALWEVSGVVIGPGGRRSRVAGRQMLHEHLPRAVPQRHHNDGDDAGARP
jgi:hypothetical protein